MRSVIKKASASGVGVVVNQQFDIGKRIIAEGLVPIVEPAVDINCPDTAEAEGLLRTALRAEIDQITDDQIIMLKLTLPEEDGFYVEFVADPKVLKVVALSGGYSREEANGRLSRNPGVVASFSRALAEGLNARQSAEEFDSMLGTTIDGIYQASLS